ncbi:FixH family protein [Thalassotalea litorea]|uniref:FixH family protein n=1 Tax=Thalassotalea litorea TaxID=2020715 RepID=A0A5R9IPC9_9GAMM|nr:FixH family protein [Thalassotalea litorea]TLU66333.1 FixH family protein [Thalassotalea litorea]
MTTRWYKEPWAYFVFFLPLSAVIAGITTFIIANTNADTVVVDDYYKKGKSINLEISKIKEAEKLGVTFDMKVSDTEIILKPTGNESSFALLNVSFYHPTLAARDFNLVLTADGNGWYRQTFEQSIDGKWRIQVLPFDKRWKLQTTVALPQSDFRPFELQY